jgi:hypothetical protein
MIDAQAFETMWWSCLQRWKCIIIHWNFLPLKMRPPRFLKFSGTNYSAELMFRASDFHSGNALYWGAVYSASRFNWFASVSSEEFQVNFFKYIGTVLKFFWQTGLQVTRSPKRRHVYTNRDGSYTRTRETLSSTNFESPIVILFSHTTHNSINLYHLWMIVLLNKLRSFIFTWFLWYSFISTFVGQFTPSAPVFLKIIMRKFSSKFICVFRLRIFTLQFLFEQHLTRHVVAQLNLWHMFYIRFPFWKIEALLSIHVNYEVEEVTK